MLSPPHSPEQIATEFPDVKILGPPCSGGQKLVFPCKKDKTKFALKIIFIPTSGFGSDELEDFLEDIKEKAARAKREFDTIRACSSPHLVKPGPIPYGHKLIADIPAIYFTEEWIEGKDLALILGERNYLPHPELIRLADEISAALAELWTHNKIHRDVKPKNIMKKGKSGTYVLIDLGLAFDFASPSITQNRYAIPGTVPYLAPERADPSRKRQIDIRSDLFSLGAVLYEAATNTHPFLVPGLTKAEVLHRICTMEPKNPRHLNEALPDTLDRIIMRLLSKQPHLRYRTIEAFRDDLEEVRAELKL